MQKAEITHTQGVFILLGIKPLNFVMFVFDILFYIVLFIYVLTFFTFVIKVGQIQKYCLVLFIDKNIKRI